MLFGFIFPLFILYITTSMSNFEFFTGVPGSRWSGIAREIKADPQYDSSDRAEHREYKHHGFAGHRESYFGTGMEFDCNLSEENLCAPFTTWDGNLTKLIMSHEWPYHFDQIQQRYPHAPITLIYRPDQPSMDWWLEAGGFDITYPNYKWYVDHDGMWDQIVKQNKLILDFAQQHSVQWIQHHKHSDIFVGTHRLNVD